MKNKLLYLAVDSSHHCGDRFDYMREHFLLVENQT
jgi:hypothetical protein